MSMKVKALFVSGGGTAGTQDITSAGFGTPKAAIFISCYQQAAIVPAISAHAWYSYGHTDGTDQYCASGNSQNAVGTTQTTRQQWSNKVMHMVHQDDGSSVYLEAAFDSMITDGVRIDWTTTITDRAFIVILIGGDISAKVKNVAFSTEDTLVHVEDIGFEADILFTAGISASTLDITASSMVLNLGFVHNDRAGGITQRGIISSDEDNRSTSRTSGLFKTDAVCGQIGNSLNHWDADFSNFDSSGFDCHARNDDSGSDFVSVLAIEAPNTNIYVGTVDTPTSTGNDSQTDAGFKPEFVMHLLSFHSSVDTPTNDGTGGAFGVHIFDDGVFDQTEAIRTEDGQGTSDTDRISLDNMDFSNDSGSSDITSTFVSMDGTGWTRNYSDVDGTARKLAVLAIGQAGPVNVAKINGVAVVGIDKRNGKTYSTISKINGVA